MIYFPFDLFNFLKSCKNVNSQPFVEEMSWIAVGVLCVCLQKRLQLASFVQFFHIGPTANEIAVHKHARHLH